MNHRQIQCHKAFVSSKSFIVWAVSSLIHFELILVSTGPTLFIISQSGYILFQAFHEKTALATLSKVISPYLQGLTYGLFILFHSLYVHLKSAPLSRLLYFCGKFWNQEMWCPQTVLFPSLFLFCFIGYLRSLEVPLWVLG